MQIYNSYSYTVLWVLQNLAVLYWEQSCTYVYYVTPVIFVCTGYDVFSMPDKEYK